MIISAYISTISVQRCHSILIHFVLIIFGYYSKHNFNSHFPSHSHVFSAYFLWEVKDLLWNNALGGDPPRVQAPCVSAPARARLDSGPEGWEWACSFFQLTITAAFSLSVVWVVCSHLCASLMLICVFSSWVQELLLYFWFMSFVSDMTHNMISNIFSCSVTCYSNGILNGTVYF